MTCSFHRVPARSAGRAVSKGCEVRAAATAGGVRAAGPLADGEPEGAADAVTDGPWLLDRSGRGPARATAGAVARVGAGTVIAVSGTTRSRGLADRTGPVAVGTAAQRLAVQEKAQPTAHGVVAGGDVDDVGAVGLLVGGVRDGGRVDGGVGAAGSVFQPPGGEAGGQ